MPRACPCGDSGLGRRPGLRGKGACSVAELRQGACFTFERLAGQRRVPVKANRRGCSLHSLLLKEFGRRGLQVRKQKSVAVGPRAVPLPNRHSVFADPAVEALTCGSRDLATGLVIRVDREASMTRQRGQILEPHRSEQKEPTSCKGGERLPVCTQMFISPRPFRELELNIWGFSR